MKSEIKRYRDLMRSSKEFQIFIKEFSKGFDIKGNYSYILSKFDEYKINRR